MPTFSINGQIPQQLSQLDYGYFEKCVTVATPRSDIPSPETAFSSHES